MFTMAVGQSDDVDALEAARQAIAQCREQLGDRTARGALLFVGYDAFEPAIVAEVKAAFPLAAICGSTSAAEMSSVGGYQDDAVTLAVFSTDDVDITVGAASDVAANIDEACRAAVAQALAGTDKPPRLGIVLADALAGQHALEAVRRALPDGVALVGGAASGANLPSPRPNFEFEGARVVENGISVMLFSGPLAFSVAVGTGLRPVGPEGVVTASEDGRILEIDDRPAAAFVRPYIDVPGAATFGNPLAFRDDDASEPYLRAMLGEDPSGALMIPGSVPVGARVQLSTASTDDIVRATTDVTSRAAATFPADATPAGALLFSCAVRRFMLGSRTAQEVTEARSMLPPSLPVAGMYCAGEIAPVSVDPAHTRFHNETFVAVLLGA
jgi:hypothetical protein